MPRCPTALRKPQTRTLRRLALAVLALVGMLACETRAQPAPQSVVWGQELFVIPYRWSGGSDQSAVSEVVLYLSQDQGVSWDEVTRARPDVQSFMYRAPRDGEYWFAIRTLDSTGRSWPTGPLQAELRVVVDTRLPTITIHSATISPDGLLSVTAVASDPQLDAASIEVAILDPATHTWRAVRPTVTSNAPHSATISASESVPRGALNVMVRVTAKDRAGNPASAGRAAIGTTPFGFNSNPTAATPVATVPPDPFTRSSAWRPPSNTATAAVPPQQQASAGTHGWQSSSTQEQQLWRPDNQPLQSLRAEGAAAPGTTAAAPSAYRFASNRPTTQLPPTGITQPPQEKLLVNSDRFELQYDLKSVGPWGVSKVEVWGTQDQGATWRSFAVDTDLRSPVDVQTPGDGLYGFAIVVQSVGGLEQPPPRAGDRAEVLVEVDRTRPGTQLLSAAQPDGYFADHLVFAWRVEDANLAEQPISLLYAAKPSGPWQPIASNLANSGRYSWRLQRHLPAEVYLRLEARDRAGNIGVDQTSRPVAIRLPESTGQILQVRPLE